MNRLRKWEYKTRGWTLERETEERERNETQFV